MSLFERKSYIAINNGKVITKNYYYDGTGWFRLSDGEEVDLSALPEEESKKLKTYTEKAIDEIDISSSVVIKNLLQKNLKKLKKENEEALNIESQAIAEE